MREGWHKTTIGTLISSGAIQVHKDGNHGANYPRVDDFGTDGLPFLTAKSISDWTIDFQGAPRLSREKAKTFKFGFVKGGDVLLSHNATVGRVAIVPEGEETAVIGTSLTQFRVDRSKILPEFLALYFSSREFQEQLSFVMAQTTRNQVPITEQRKLPIQLPDLGAQQAIVDVAFGLIDKIELNRKMNATLEAMARALFRDWFVDFGPTRAKMEARPPYFSPDLWPLFPARLDDEGKPEGWEEKPLDEVADFLNGLALQKFPGEGEADSLPVIKIAELRNGITANSNRASRKVPSQYVIKDGDFLFSWSGSLLAKFWTGGEGALNQHLFKVTSDRYPAWFFSEWVQHHLEEFQIIAASKATTMGHIQRGHLKAAMTICPPDNTITRLGEAVAPLIHRIVRNELESRTLAQTRDLLLPRLMSGELRVADINSEEAEHA